MGEVIKFPVERVRRTTGRGDRTEGVSEVLVFEGIRYSTSNRDVEEREVCPVAEPSS